MKNKKIKLLKDLISIPSPSGFEGNIAEFIRKELLQYLPKTRVKIDEYKNVIAIIKGTSDKKIMIDAHSDTIGFVVTNVDRSGLISLQYIGGGDIQILPARYLNILTSTKKLNAIIGRKHAHLNENEDDIKIEHIKDVFIDIGIRGRKQVLRKIKIGDPVVYKPYFEELEQDKKLGQYIAGYGIDNKSGCFVLMETIREIIKSKKKPIPTLIFTFSTQEEIGKAKVRQLIKKYKPDLFIGTDVTFATDCSDSEDDEIEREVGRCELGKGCVLYKGVGISKETVKLLISIAQKHKIKLQYQASKGDIGYNSDIATDYISKAVIVGIPLRNMHSITEAISTKDLNYGIRLLTSFCISKEIRRIL